MKKGSLLGGTVLAAVFIFGSAYADEMSVSVDHAAPLSTDKGAVSVVVGNPAVADITTHNDSTFFVVGRTIGTTNVVALDGSGQTISDTMVHVTAPGSGRVVLHRSSERISYACAPQCERTQIQGDANQPYADLDDANKRKLDLAKKAKEASQPGP